MRRMIVAVCMAALLMPRGTARAADESVSWADKIKLSGDVRYRHEYIDQENKDSRTRHRVRARLAATAAVNDELDAIIGLASGSSDPVSSNQSLGEGASSKEIMLDLAYFDWHPEAVGGANLMGGKMKNPFETVSDLVWDGDLRPEGLAATWKAKGDAVEFTVKAGGFWFEERSADDDTMLYAGQAALKFKGEDMSFTAGASYYYWDNMEGFGTLADASDDLDSFGNTVTEVTEPAVDPLAEPVVIDLLYANGFEEVEAFAELSLDALPMPVRIFGQYVMNSDADDDDTGYLVGLKAGKIKDPGSFQFAYDYRHLEANAVVGAFTDSDSFGGGTDGEGHRISAAVGLSKNWQAGITYFVNDAGISGDAVDYKRLQVDLAAKF